MTFATMKATADIEMVHPRCRVLGHVQCRGAASGGIFLLHYVQKVPYTTSSAP